MAATNSELSKKLNSRVAEVTGKPKSVADELQLFFNREDTKQQLAVALPASLGLTTERLARLAITEIRTSPKLMECTKESLIASIIKAFQLGLEIGSHIGHAYLVPFNNKKKDGNGVERWVKEVQLILGYKGVLSLARRSGEVVSIASHMIHKNDEFRLSYGWCEELHHRPAFPDRGEVIGVYAYAKTKDGGQHSDIMTVEDVESIRGRSKAAQSGPWVTDWNEMARKTVAKRLCKWLPMSIEMREAVHDDESREFIETTATPTPFINLGDAPSAPSVETQNDDATTREEPDDQRHDEDSGEQGHQLVEETRTTREPGDDDHGGPSQVEQFRDEIEGTDSVKGLADLKGRVVATFTAKLIEAHESAALIDAIGKKREALKG